MVHIRLSELWLRYFMRISDVDEILEKHFVILVFVCFLSNFRLLIEKLLLFEITIISRQLLQFCILGLCLFNFALNWNVGACKYVLADCFELPPNINYWRFFTIGLLERRRCFGKHVVATLLCILLYSKCILH